jgi:hypothetical protein
MNLLLINKVNLKLLFLNELYELPYINIKSSHSIDLLSKVLLGNTP